MISLMTSFQQMTANTEQSLTRVAKQPQIEREVAYYKANIGSVKSIDDLMKNQRLYNFAMDAFGLSDMKYAKAFMRKALTEGIDSADAFSVKLADTRFREFVSTFNFARNGSTTTIFEAVQKGVVDKYIMNSFQEQAGQQSEGLKLALYFRNNAANLTSTYSILANKAVFAVVRTALGLPEAMSSVDIDKQKAILDSKINIEDFKDPEKLDKFINRFLAQYQMQNPDESTVTSPALSVLASGSSLGVDMNTLLSMQSLKRFGS